MCIKMILLDRRRVTLWYNGLFTQMYKYTIISPIIDMCITSTQIC